MSDFATLALKHPRRLPPARRTLYYDLVSSMPEQGERSVAYDYKGFIEKFLKVANASLERDAVGRKRKLENVDSAEDIRFRLGGDSNAYLQLGVSLLQTSAEGDAKLPLAPPHLFGADTLQATKEGLKAAARADAKRRRLAAP